MTLEESRSADGGGLAALLRSGSDRIVEIWAERARERPNAQALPKPLLIDHIPMLLADIARLAESRGAPAAVQETAVDAAHHAHERIILGYDVEAVVDEYGVLRQVILEELERSGSMITGPELRLLAWCIDRAIATAVAAYAHAKHETLETDRARLETAVRDLARAERRQRFLSEAGYALASILDEREALQRIATLAVPTLADWCAVDLLVDDRMETVALAHADPAKEVAARALRTQYPPHPDDEIGPWNVTKTGQAQLLPVIDDAQLRARARDDSHFAMMKDVAPRSAVIAPLCARGRPLGAITLVVGADRTPLGDADLDLATDLGQLAGLAVENARLLRESQNAVRAREDVLAVVSHDLRTHLAVVQMGSSVLYPKITDARQVRQIEAIQRAASRMLRLIGDLVDMASIRAGRLAMAPAARDAEEIARDAIESVEPLAREQGITLRAELETRGARAWCDAERIQQVFGNLTANAIKVCRGGCTLTVSARCAADRIRYAVTDTGPGVPQEIRDKLFEPYWTGNREADRRGTGLGLFIAKGIVEAHGGEIGVETEVGRGTTFWFTVPLAAD